MGCQPGDHSYAVGTLLEWGCNPNSRGSRGDTVMMQMGGAGHVAMFTFFYKRIVKHSWTCDLDVVNLDGRNLWSIVGLAHEEAGGKRKRPHVNTEIKLMVQHFADLEYLQPQGLATHSTTNRGKLPPHRASR